MQGAPENQLRGPFENFLAHVARAWGENVVCTGEAPLPDRLGRPNYAIHRSGLLAGYVELNPPGAGANATHFKGHDRAQFKRFAAIPNILYTDGNEWALYRSGEHTGKLVRLSGDVAGVRYARIEGSRNEKLAALAAMDGFASVTWRDCPDVWQAPFRPAGEGDYFGWPLQADLMPWQHSGAQFKRTWPIAKAPRARTEQAHALDLDGPAGCTPSGRS